MRYKKAPEGDVDYILGLLGTIYPLSEELRQAFHEKTVSLSVKKGAVLLQEGERCEYMYFIKRGAMMGKTIHQKKQIVTYISIDNEFVSSISGLHGVVPSKEAIVAVEDTELIAMHNDDLQELFAQYFDMNYFFRVMVEQYYRDAQERSYIIRVGNAKERYLYFVNTKPGYVERLPLELVASMLDMKLATLLKVQKQYQLSLQKDRDTEFWCKEIEVQMLEQEVYKVTSFNLTDFAKILNIAPQKLSSILNNVYRSNFVDFINSYRINSIKKQMSDPFAMQHYTLEALARNAGFASRSAFYSCFKKQVGVSPTEYLKNLEMASLAV